VGNDGHDRDKDPGGPVDERVDERVDGRRARGDERRRAIAEAVIAVIGQHGAGGVTHRRVAEAAGVPLGSTTYYFATLSDLLVAGMTLAMERNAAAMRALTDDLATGRPLARVLAERAVELATDHRDLYLAECELYLVAAREPALRADARAFTTTMAEVIRPWVVSDAAAVSVVFIYEGLLFEALLADQPPTTDEIYPLLAPVIGALERER
jgi:DNA-binding transcriptional regulator YbjK